MILLGKRILLKYEKKNLGNRVLSKAISKLINDFEKSEIKSYNELVKLRPDADKIHPDGFYFFNLDNHRTMILVEFSNDDASIIWCGNHKDYQSTFKNNKNTIKKWLKAKNLVR